MQRAVVLKAGRDKPVRHRHPWIFSGAIQHLPDAADGAIVPVTDAKGRWLAQGYLNRRSQIQVRLLSWEPDETINEEFWQNRLAKSIERRADLAEDEQTTCYRLVHGESDYLPGLTVDRYSDYLVMQVGTLGIDLHKQRLAEMLLEITGCLGVIERSELGVRRKEGLQEATGLLAGSSPSELVTVLETGLQFHVDILGGQKTGFYLDQRMNRQRVASWCQGGTVLNIFSYTGAFAVHALAQGAQHVVNVDTSIDALELGEENLRLNGFDPEQQTETIAGDVFEVLRDWRDFGGAIWGEGEAASGPPQFDVVILDPPKFVQSQRHLDRGLRGYKDINLLAMQLVRPGGILATCSCSGLVSMDLFQKVVFGAAIDAERDVQILEWLHQSNDHPIAITFPEGAYLKGMVCRVL